MQLKKSKFPYLYVISLVILFLYPLRHVHMGVDMWDGGYNYANFTYNSLEYMDSMWYFATWIANAVGSFLTLLPFGNTMLGMNVYTGMIISIIAVSTYIFCVRKLHIPAWITFAGEILAVSLCWAPSSALYTYLTYGFLLTGVMLLYQGLTTGQNRYLILAGVALGLNVGVRFSNLVQMSLILAVWYYAFIAKKKFSEVLRDTGFCILGYVGAFGLFLIVISVVYGFDNYIEGIVRLFAMTEHATDYSATSMLIGMVWAYYDSSYWLKRFALAGAVALAICFALPRTWGHVKKAATWLITLVLMAWLLGKGYCTTDYATYNSFYYPCIICFIITLALSVLQLLDRNVKKEDKLQALFVLLMLSLTSLGGNNAIYSSINNLFLVLPCFFWLAYRFVKEREHILFYPFKTVIIMSILLFMVQGFLFGKGFVYEQATGGRDFETEITQIPVLSGMHTGSKKVKELEQLYEFIQENNLQDRECILYGNIPGIAYYMELAPAINIWSDLRSYSAETMLGDLEEIKAEIRAEGDYPVVILNKKYLSYYTKGNENCLPEEETAAQKLIILGEFMDEMGYDHTADYVGKSYVIFLKN